MHRIFLQISLSATLLAACNPISPPVAATTLPILVTAPPTQTIPPDTVMQIVERARTHLIKKFKLSSDQVSVFSVQAVTWPDASLGCPQQSISDAQVETPGYIILLESGGKVYTYHTDANATVILCDASGPGEIFLPPGP